MLQNYWIALSHKTQKPNTPTRLHFPKSAPYSKNRLVLSIALSILRNQGTDSPHECSDDSARKSFVKSTGWYFVFWGGGI